MAVLDPSSNPRTAASAAFSAERSPPVHLGPFRLLSPIARGGMSEVWRAVHAPTGHKVAVKVLSGAAYRHRHFQAAFQNEVRSMAWLDHPHIALVLDHGVVDEHASQTSGERLAAGTPWLAIEHASGGALSTRGVTPDWPTLQSTLLALLSALGHAHARGVVHLDVKPGNILMCSQADPRPGLKLTDFGIAWIQGGPDTPAETGGKRAGTPTYMAPEQFLGEVRDFGPWTDLYALGCVAWRLATGAPPFTLARPDELMKAHCTLRPATPELSTDLPRGLLPWLYTLLEKRPEARFSCAADAAAALRELHRPHRAPRGGRRVDLPFLASEATTRDETSQGSLPSLSADTVTLAASLEPTALDPIQLAVLPRPLRPLPPLPRDWRSAASEPTFGAVTMGMGPSLLGLRQPPMVGREKLRDRLWSTLCHVHQHHATSALVLTGPAGAGKSRLAEWLSQLAGEVGAAVALRSRCQKGRGTDAALLHAVTSSMRLDGLEPGAAWRRLAGQLTVLGNRDSGYTRALGRLLRLAESASDPATEGPGEWNIETADGRQAVLVHWLGLMCRQRPVVWWLDDVLYAPSTLTFVRAVLEQGELPCLFVLTLRDGEYAPGSDIAFQLRELSRLAPRSALEVAPLTDEEGRALCRTLLLVEPGLEQHLFQRAGGNPLFLAQLVGDLVARGLLAPGEGGLHLTEGAELALPDSIHQLWLARVHQAVGETPAPLLHGLCVAAALGDSFQLEEWSATCKRLNLALVRDDLEPLLDQRLLQTEPGQYALTSPRELRFAHGLLAESLRRHTAESGIEASLHQACARALEELYRNPDLDLQERLGGHQLKAGELDKALARLTRVCEERLRQGELDLVERLCTDALKALDRAGIAPEEPRRLRIELPLLTVRRLSGSVGEVYRKNVALHQQALASGVDELILKAWSGLATSAVDLGLYGEGTGHFQQLLERHKAAGRTDAAMVTRLFLGRCYLQAGKLEKAQEQVDTWLDWTGSKAPHFVDYAKLMSALIAVSAYRWEDADQTLTQLDEALSRGGNRSLHGVTLCSLGFLRGYQGKMKLSRERLGAGLTLLREQRSLLTLVVTELDQAALERAFGDRALARELFTRSLAYLEHVESRTAAAAHLGLALDDLMSNELGQAGERIAQASPLVDGTGCAILIQQLSLAKLALAAFQGEPDHCLAALEQFEQCVSGGLSLPPPDLAPLLLVMRTIRRTGDPTLWTRTQPLAIRLLAQSRSEHWQALALRQLARAG